MLHLVRRVPGENVFNRRVVNKICILLCPSIGTEGTAKGSCASLWYGIYQKEYYRDAFRAYKTLRDMLVHPKDRVAKNQKSGISVQDYMQGVP